MKNRLFAALSAILVTVSLAATSPAGAVGKTDKPGKPITVMTRNLYLGADINRPVEAALAAAQQGKSQIEVTIALANAADETRDIVDATDFGVRARLVASEIAATQPDLVGLQEVSLWRSGPLELDQVGETNATTVDYDFLALLLDEISEQGEEYVAVSIGMRADIEAPSFSGSPLDGSWDEQRDVRLTMRDVILMHVEDGLSVTGSGDRIFTHNLSLDLLGNEINFDRGFQWVDVRAGATRLRFVNSHFEAFSSDLAFAQASELLAIAPASDRTTVFTCDCNSDPLNNSIKPVDQLPHKAAYDLITGPGGFTDMWLEFAPADQGWTSGLSETVDDDSAAGFDHRIDMVFAKSPDGHPLSVDRGQITGNELADRDPATGLWPSDHAGVVLRLRRV